MSNTATADAMTNDGTGYGSKKYRSYVLMVLLLVYTLNFIDRSLMGVVGEEIKKDFLLSDFQLGLLNGPPFAIFYAVMGLPIALWADRGNRVKIITFCIILWSVMTALCGIAAGFLVLLLFRVGVAVGEAGCTPPANSIIGDYYPPRSRANALGIYSMGVTIGTTLAFLFGGKIAGLNGVDFGIWLNTTGLGGLFSGIDWATVKGWRIAFVIVGLPGVLIGLVLWLTVKEPPRGYSDGGGASSAEKASFNDTYRELFSKPSFWWMAFGAAFVAFVGYGLFGFQNSFLQRVHGLGVGEASINYGAPWAIMAAVGTFIGGFLTERLSRKSASYIALIPVVGLLLAIPLYISAFYANDLRFVFLLWGAGAVMHYMYLSSQYMIGQGVVSARSRATAIAVLLIIVSLIGNGIGPPFVGAMSDLFMNMNLGAAGLGEAAASIDPNVCVGAAEGALSEIEDAYCSASKSGLRLSMVATVLFFLISASCYFICSRTLKRDLVAEVEA